MTIGDSSSFRRACADRTTPFTNLDRETSKHCGMEPRRPAWTSGKSCWISMPNTTPLMWWSSLSWERSQVRAIIFISASIIWFVRWCKLAKSRIYIQFSPKYFYDCILSHLFSARPASWRPRNHGWKILFSHWEQEYFDSHLSWNAISARTAGETHSCGARKRNAVRWTYFSTEGNFNFIPKETNEVPFASHWSRGQG